MLMLRTKWVANRPPYGNGERSVIPRERTGNESRHGPRSSTSTFTPERERRLAEMLPPKPLPMTTTSWDVSDLASGGPSSFVTANSLLGYRCRIWQPSYSPTSHVTTH